MIKHRIFYFVVESEKMYFFGSLNKIEDEFLSLGLFNITSVTTHSLAYRATMDFFSRKLKSNKRFRFVLKLSNSDQMDLYCSSIIIVKVSTHILM